MRKGSGVLPCTPKPVSVSFSDSEHISLTIGSPYGGDAGPDPYPTFTYASGGFQVERFAASLVAPRPSTVTPPAVPPRPLRPLSQPQTIRAPRPLSIIPAPGSFRKFFARDDEKGYPRSKETQGKENSREWLLPHEHVERSKARASPAFIAERRRTVRTTMHGKRDVPHEDGLDSDEKWRSRHRKALLVESRVPPSVGHETERRGAARRDVRSVFGVSNR